MVAVSSGQGHVWRMHALATSSESTNFVSRGENRGRVLAPEQRDSAALHAQPRPHSRLAIGLPPTNVAFVSARDE